MLMMVYSSCSGGGLTPFPSPMERGAFNEAHPLPLSIGEGKGVRPLLEQDPYTHPETALTAGYRLPRRTASECFPSPSIPIHQQLI